MNSSSVPARRSRGNIAVPATDRALFQEPPQPILCLSQQATAPALQASIVHLSICPFFRRARGPSMATALAFPGSTAHRHHSRRSHPAPGRSREMAPARLDSTARPLQRPLPFRHRGPLPEMALALPVLTVFQSPHLLIQPRPPTMGPAIAMLPREPAHPQGWAACLTLRMDGTVPMSL